MITFLPIEEWLQKDYNERTAHLILSEPCIEIGSKSGDCRALVAHFLKTTLPSGNFSHMCHACHNPKCSNVLHLYWGTASDNMKDQYRNGRKGGFATLRAKLGEDAFRELRRELSRLGIRSKGMTVVQLLESRKEFLKLFDVAVKSGQKNEAISKSVGVSKQVVGRLRKERFGDVV